MAQSAEPWDQDSTQTVYRPAAHIRWSVEQRGLMLIDQKAGRSWELTYPEAALWDFLSRRYPVARMIHLLGSIADLDPKKAHALLQDTFTHWLQCGYLILRGQHD